MLDHLSLQCTHLEASCAFYDQVLGTLGASRVMEFGDAVGYGIGAKPGFWISQSAVAGSFRESHVAFVADDRDAVRAFHAAAVELGAHVLHEPREWPEYHPGYFAAFVRDPDGNNVEAVCHA